jgi:excinuclease UvrABC nuclease subunit
MTGWVSIEATSWHGLPPQPGVYVIFFDREPVYVGQSNNLRVRFARHAFRYGYAKNIHTPWGAIDDSIKVTCRYRLSRRYGDWAMWELRLIKTLQPRLNKVHLSRDRAA